MSLLRETLESGKFAVTTEMAPPKGTDLSHLIECAKPLVRRVHAANVKVFEISGMLVCSTNTAGCKYYIVSFNLFFPAIRPPDNSTTTLAAIAKDI